MRVTDTSSGKYVFIISFSFISGVCHHTMIGLSLVALSFFFSLHFSPLHQEMHYGLNSSGLLFLVHRPPLAPTPARLSLEILKMMPDRIPASATPCP